MSPTSNALSAIFKTPCAYRAVSELSYWSVFLPSVGNAQFLEKVWLSGEELSYHFLTNLLLLQNYLRSALPGVFQGFGILPLIMIFFFLFVFSNNFIIKDNMLIL